MRKIKTNQKSERGWMDQQGEIKEIINLLAWREFSPT